MARLQKMNIASNTHLLKKYNVSGIKIEAAGFMRYICSCGEINGSENCKCGNTEFRNTSYHGWHSNSARVEKSNMYSTEKDVVKIKYLIVTADTTTNQFTFNEEELDAFNFADGKINIFYQNTDANKILDYILNNSCEFEDTTISNVNKYLELCKELKINMENVRFEEVFNFFNNTDIDIEELKEYHRLIEGIIRNGRVSNVIDTMAPIQSIKKLLEKLNIPYEFKEYCKIKGYPSSYYSRSSSYDKCIPLLMNVMKHALLHEQIEYNDCTSMLDTMNTKSEATQEAFANFFIKNVNLFKSRTAERFEELYNLNIQYGIEEDDINVKRLSKILLLEHLKKKKCNAIRANSIVDVMDKDPMLALDLLSANKSLSAEEMKLIQKASM